MKTHLLPLLLSALIAGVSAWFIQGWRMGEQMQAQAANLSKQHLVQIRNVIQSERASHEQLASAQLASRQREQILRRDAAATRSELERLRDASAGAVRMSSESHDSCIERASALRDVFDQCATQYGELAEAAGRHVSDIKTLMQAWPISVSMSADSESISPE